MNLANKSKSVIANWKMHGSLTALESWLKHVSTWHFSKPVNIIWALPYCYLFAAKIAYERQTPQLSLQIACQDIAKWPKFGAHTGDCSATMVQDVGATACLIGHSERRQGYHETDTDIAQKLQLALASNLMPIVCIGETLQDKQQQIHHQVIQEQLNAFVSQVNTTQEILIAYEPVWAIGQSPPAIDEVESIIKMIHDYLKPFQLRYSLLYGGGVDQHYASLLGSIENLDGLLVGSASLQAESFQHIIKHYIGMN